MPFCCVCTALPASLYISKVFSQRFFRKRKIYRMHYALLDLTLKILFELISSLGSLAQKLRQRFLSSE